MATPVLYEHPLSPYVQKCKIALREKGVAFEAKIPEGIGSGGALEGRFRGASPRQEVPALLDGEVSVFDSTVILEYLEDRWPEPRLLPAEPRERARVRMLEDLMDTHYEAINWGLGEIRFFERGKGSCADALWDRAGEQLRRWFAHLEAELGGAEWFNGRSFGWGDLAVLPFLNGSRGFGFEPEARSPLRAWLDRAHERASVAETAAEATASLAYMQDVAKWLRQGHMRREYRDHRLEWMVRSGGLEIVLRGIEARDVRFFEEP